MRLIDADKLRHELIMGHDLVGAKYTDMADTVEAIPIEWLMKEYADNNLIYFIIDNWRKENESRDTESAK